MSLYDYETTRAAETMAYAERLCEELDDYEPPPPPQYTEAELLHAEEQLLLQARAWRGIRLPAVVPGLPLELTLQAMKRLCADGRLVFREFAFKVPNSIVTGVFELPREVAR